MQIAFADVLVVFWIILLEGLLSLDNALVLATLVSASGLSEQKQKKALLYGIIGAYIFRVIAVIFAAWLIQVWWFKILGGIYLLYIGMDGLRSKDRESKTEKKLAKSSGRFWMVILQVEMMDAAFSIDSVLAAVALTDKIYLIIAGALIGILALRMVAGVFILWLKKFPILKKAAYVLVILIGLKLAASPWWHPPELIFFGLLGAIFIGSILLEKYFLKNKK